MFFNSYEFIFIFLPIALIGYFIFGKIKNVYANLWLAVLSLFSMPIGIYVISLSF